MFKKAVFIIISLELAVFIGMLAARKNTLSAAPPPIVKQEANCSVCYNDLVKDLVNDNPEIMIEKICEARK